MYPKFCDSFESSNLKLFFSDLLDLFKIKSMLYIELLALIHLNWKLVIWVVSIFKLIQLQCLEFVLRRYGTEDGGWWKAEEAEEASTGSSQLINDGN